MELTIQRDPKNITAIEREYSRNRECLDYLQKRGYDLMKVAKSYADYTRRQMNLREKIRQEEITKLQEQAGQLIDAQWKLRRRVMKRNVTRNRMLQVSFTTKGR